MIKVGNNVIINADDLSEINLIKNSSLIVISCGLKLNSTVTASSISDDGFTYCLQRTIFTISRKRIAPQEFNVKWFKKPDEIYPVLELVTAFLLCDIDLKVFRSIMF